MRQPQESKLNATIWMISSLLELKEENYCLFILGFFYSLRKIYWFSLLTYICPPLVPNPFILFYVLFPEEHPLLSFCQKTKRISPSIFIIRLASICGWLQYGN